MSYMITPGNALNEQCDILVHACNCQGVWGAGIAKQIATKYPLAYNMYKYICQTENNHLLGRGITLALSASRVEGTPLIGCLFTSLGYGKSVDSKADILANTYKSLSELISSPCMEDMGYNSIKVVSPKFNSGLFGVPWKETEQILKELLKWEDHINWIVCDLEAK